MAVARDSGGKLVLLLQDDATKKLYVGTQKGLTPLAPGVATVSGGRFISAKGYTLLHGIELFNVDRQLQSIRRPGRQVGGIRPAVDGDGRRARADAALRREARRLRAHLRRRGLRATTATASSHTTATRSSPAGRRTSASKNFSRIAHDPNVRAPFIRVFIWTFVFAGGDGVPLVRDRPLPRHRARQARACASRGSTARSSSSPGRFPASSRCSSGAACSTTSSASSTGSSTSTCRGSSTRTGPGSPASSSAPG